MLPQLTLNDFSENTCLTFSFIKIHIFQPPFTSESDDFNFHFASKYITHFFAAIYLPHSQPNKSHSIVNNYSYVCSIGKEFQSTEYYTTHNYIHFLTARIHFRFILAINIIIIYSSKMREHIHNLKIYRNLCCWLYLSVM